MKQVSQNYKTGEIRLEDTVAPSLGAGGVLVRTAFSVISMGTEGMKVREGKMSYAGKACARPDHVRKVIQGVRQQGLATTYRKVMNRLDSLTPLGYSLSGTVTAVGTGITEFVIGDRVACAGAGYANHAEINFVPRNLVVPVSDNVAMRDAAFTTVGAIAMQGYRQAGMQLGETAVVIGLGLIGQLLVQILGAAGVQVIGTDLAEDRCELAHRAGVAAAMAPGADFVQLVGRLTGGVGADCVFLATSAKTNDPVTLAAEVARDRGRLVDIGKTRLDLEWKDFYEKELDVRFSRSYGPGRYDATYEEHGVDYPVGYVRWTERRNMSSFLDLLKQRRIDLEPLVSGIFPFAEAGQVYADLAAGKIEGVGVLFDYGDHEVEARRPQTAAATAAPQDSVRLTVVGAGKHAGSMLIPHLAGDRRVVLQEVVTATGLSGSNILRKYPFERAGTDFVQAAGAPDVDAVLIATRHADHATMTAAALRAGKAVFVEKPLAIDVAGLLEVSHALDESAANLLQVGFNRRFAPAVQSIRDFFGNREGPLVLNYRVHAGKPGSESWQADPRQGSQFVGEAGHFFDVFAFLTGSHPSRVYAQAIRPSEVAGEASSNLSVTVTYEDGSVATLLYLTQGASRTPKEWLEVFGNGKTAQLDNFKRVIFYEGSRRRTGKHSGRDKGMKAELNAFVTAVKAGTAMPIPVDSLIETTLVTLAAEASVVSGTMIQLADYWKQEP